MRYGDPELLFCKYDMHSLMSHRQSQIVAAPGGMNDDTLLNTPTEDLVQELFERYRLVIPVLDRENAVADPSEGPVEIHDAYFSGRGRGEAVVVHGSIVELVVPYTGDIEFFRVRPTTYDLSPPRAHLEPGKLVLIHKSRELNGEQATAALNSVLNDIDRYLTWLRGSADPFNENIRGLLRKAIQDRKTKILKDRNSAAALGFKLKARADAPQTYVAPITRKKIVPAQAPRASAQPYKPEWALESQVYEEILKTIESMALVMERSPSAFVKMKEEDLRQHFLMPLNAQFEGAASGETFNYGGKTDILIRVEDRNIFIAECKFWGGPKAFTETIDQLLGYLSWRDTKAAVIIFNRNKDFSAVVKSAVETANAHPDKKRGPERQGDTRFRYVFGNPTDHNREVILTVLMFDVPH